jgi:hypothetical protein
MRILTLNSEILPVVRSLQMRLCWSWVLGWFGYGVSVSRRRIFDLSAPVCEGENRGRQEKKMVFVRNWKPDPRFARRVEEILEKGRTYTAVVPLFDGIRRFERSFSQN